MQSIIESSVTNSVTSTVPNKNLSTMRPLTAAYHASQSHNEVNVLFLLLKIEMRTSYRLYLQTPTHPRKTMDLYPKQWNIFLAGNIFLQQNFAYNIPLCAFCKTTNLLIICLATRARDYDEMKLKN